MLDCFKMGNIEASDVKILSAIQSRLELYSLETADLIHQYYMDRLEYQKNQTSSQYGQLTIMANLTDSGLVVSLIKNYTSKTILIFGFLVKYFKCSQLARHGL